MFAYSWRITKHMYINGEFIDSYSASLTQILIIK
jgi:hypothetical protein